MNRSFYLIIKFFKWASILVLGVLLILVLGLELFYLYTVNKLELEKIHAKYNAPQAAYHALWVSNDEEGEMVLEKTSASGLVFGILRLVSSGNPRVVIFPLPKGSTSASQVSRHLTLEKRQFIFDRHGRLDGVVTMIWLTRNSNISDIQAYILENAYYGQQANGLEDASFIYFNKKATDLTLDEAVTLVTLIKAPSRYKELCQSRRFRRRLSYIVAALKDNWPNKYGEYTFVCPQFAAGIVQVPQKGN